MIQVHGDYRERIFLDKCVLDTSIISALDLPGVFFKRSISRDRSRFYPVVGYIKPQGFKCCPAVGPYPNTGKISLQLEIAVCLIRQPQWNICCILTK